MVTVNHTREEWSEAMEFQPFCPQIGILLGNAFISIYSNSNVHMALEKDNDTMHLSYFLSLLDSTKTIKEFLVELMRNLHVV